MKIKQATGRKVAYWEGAIAQNMNNPVFVAYDECEAEPGAVEIIASFGTGRKPPKVSETHKTELHTNWSLLKDMRRNITDAHAIHVRFKEYIDLVNKVRESQDEQRVTYMRFNVQHGGKDKGPIIGSDEWIPANGGRTTKSRIKTAVDECLERPKVRRDLQILAYELVRKRRLRAATRRWHEFVASVD